MNWSPRRPFAGSYSGPGGRKVPCSSHSAPRSARNSPATTGRSSPSSRWSQASATRSGTRSGVPCCPHPRGGGHVDPYRGRTARVHHGARGQGRRHRPHPEPQAACRLLGARRAGGHVPAQAGAGRGHRGRHRAPAGVEVHNPELHIATLNSKGKLEMELTVERGRWVRLSHPEQAAGQEIGRISIDFATAKVHR